MRGAFTLPLHRGTSSPGDPNRTVQGGWVQGECVRDYRDYPLRSRLAAPLVVRGVPVTRLRRPVRRPRLPRTRADPLGVRSAQGPRRRRGPPPAGGRLRDRNPRPPGKDESTCAARRPRGPSPFPRVPGRPSPSPCRRPPVPAFRRRPADGRPPWPGNRPARSG